MAKVLCVEIGCTTIRLCEMDYKAKCPKIYRSLEIATPIGAISDGYLLVDKLEEVKNAILEVLAANKVRTKKVIFSVHSSRIITREISIPAVKKELIGDVIMTNVTEYFPIDANDYVLGHSVIDTYYDDNNEGHHKTFVMAAEKDLVRMYEKLAENCGWKLLDIVYTGNAIYQVVKTAVEEGAEMFVRVEPENAMVTIIQDGKFALQRTINFGAGSIADTEREMKEIMPQLTSSLIRILDFYASMLEDKKIGCIHVLGKCAEYAILTREIERETGIPCKVLDSLTGIKVLQAEEGMEIFCLVSCIGAGYAPAGLTRVSAKDRETNYFSVSILLTVMFIVAGAAICAISILPYKEELLRERELLRQEQTYSPAKPVYERFVALSELHKHILYGNELTKHANDGLLEFLEELEEKLPNNVSVEEFVSDDEQASITMRVVDKETAAGIIETLRTFDSLMTVSVTDIDEEMEEKANTTGKLEVLPTEVVFTIYCTYYPMNPEAPASEQEIAENTSAEIVK